MRACREERLILDQSDKAGDQIKSRKKAILNIDRCH